MLYSPILYSMYIIVVLQHTTYHFHNPRPAPKSLIGTPLPPVRAKPASQAPMNRNSTSSQPNPAITATPIGRPLYLVSNPAGTVAIGYPPAAATRATGESRGNATRFKECCSSARSMPSVRAKCLHKRIASSRVALLLLLLLLLALALSLLLTFPAFSEGEGLGGGEG